jgi:hypothetical protein
MIILFGEGCQISWDIEKLKINKGKTGLFEWFLSVKFSDINKIMSKLANNEQLIMTRQNEFPNDIFMDETNIRSTHFKSHLFVDTINRRAARLISNIKSENYLIFIRYEHCEYTTTLEDIELFHSYIIQINPNCQYKLLLFKALDTNPTLIHDNLIHLSPKDKINLLNILSDLVSDIYV